MSLPSLLDAATEADVLGDKTVRRCVQRLVHLRMLWQPGTAGWLNHLVLRGKQRLTDTKFIEPVRYRLAASRCNEVIREGETAPCRCPSRWPLPVSGDPPPSLRTCVGLRAPSGDQWMWIEEGQFRAGRAFPAPCGRVCPPGQRHETSHTQAALKD